MTEEGPVEPVSRLRFGTAKASDLCVSASFGDLPGVGETSFKLVSEGKNSVDADNLIAGAKVLQSDLSVTNPLLGVDVSQRNPNAWDLVSDDINVQTRNIQATSVAANKLTVANVSVTMKRRKENVCGVG